LFEHILVLLVLVWVYSIRSMFTYVIIYICLYFLTLGTLFFFLFSYRANSDCTKWSFTKFLSAYSTYSPYSWVIKFLLLQLGGIPPFFFFIIKLNFVILSFAFVDIFLVFFIFLNILLGMFFYLKVFSLQGEHISNDTLRELLLNSNVNLSNNRYITVRKYFFWMWFFFYIFINSLSVVFLNDLIILINYFTM
jgi:NADH:ubiquinone oxidoreductase subunit 2 (subunit N)